MSAMVPPMTAVSHAILRSLKELCMGLLLSGACPSMKLARRVVLKCHLQ